MLANKTAHTEMAMRIHTLHLSPRPSRPFFFSLSLSLSNTQHTHDLFLFTSLSLYRSPPHPHPSSLIFSNRSVDLGTDSVAHRDFLLNGFRLLARRGPSGGKLLTFSLTQRGPLGFKLKSEVKSSGVVQQVMGGGGGINIQGGL